MKKISETESLENYLLLPSCSSSGLRKRSMFYLRKDSAFDKSCDSCSLRPGLEEEPFVSEKLTPSLTPMFGKDLRCLLRIRSSRFFLTKKKS